MIFEVSDFVAAERMNIKLNKISRQFHLEAKKYTNLTLKVCCINFALDFVTAKRINMKYLKVTSVPVSVVEQTLSYQVIIHSRFIFYCISSKMSTVYMC